MSTTNHGDHACGNGSRDVQPCPIHVPCWRCNYDVFGIPQGSECPECGMAVATSTASGRLFLTPERIVRGLLWATGCWIMGQGIFFLQVPVILVASMLMRGLPKFLESPWWCLLEAAIVFGLPSVAVSLVAWCYAFRSESRVQLAVAVLVWISTVVVLLHALNRSIDLFARGYDIVRETTVFTLFVQVCAAVAIAAFHILVRGLLGRDCDRFTSCLLLTAAVFYASLCLTGGWLADLHWAAVFLPIAVAGLVSVTGVALVIVRILRIRRFQRRFAMR